MKGGRPVRATRGPGTFRFCADQAECISMQQQSVRKTYKYRLMPAPAQEQVLETVLHRCRTLYNVALEQRKTWWQRGQGIGATYYQQKAELPDLKDACPEYTEVHSQVFPSLPKSSQVFPSLPKSCRMSCCA